MSLRELQPVTIFRSVPVSCLVLACSLAQAADTKVFGNHPTHEKPLFAVMENGKAVFTIDGQKIILSDFKFDKSWTGWEISFTPLNQLDRTIDSMSLQFFFCNASGVILSDPAKVPGCTLDFLSNRTNYPTKKVITIPTELRTSQPKDVQQVKIALTSLNCRLTVDETMAAWKAKQEQARKASEEESRPKIKPIAVKTQEEQALITALTGKRLFHMPSRDLWPFYFIGENGEELPSQVSHPRVIFDMRFLDLVEVTIRSERRHGILVQFGDSPDGPKRIAVSNLSKILPSITEYSFEGLRIGSPFRWDEKTNQRVKGHEAWVGMTPEQAWVSIGLPDKINKTETKRVMTEQWVYTTHRANDRSDSHGVTYLYFTNGKCSAIQRSE